MNALIVILFTVPLLLQYYLVNTLTLRRHNMKTALLLIYSATIYSAASVASFCPTFLRQQQRLSLKSPQPIKSSALFVVTEEDVIAKVEEAEALWAKAYEARKTANELSEKAEAIGQDAEVSTSDATEALKQSISLEKVADATNAQNLSLDLGNVLDQALKAQEAADEIEAQAEKALAASEAALEQHLIDFPENA
mmetsp:Transcript_13908/g.22860  ORF Transcript_13908/g.22860 Transcript_13908/m.22860 type:complete len:195 (+) Transcript_13908:3071-3655(+)